MLQKAKREDTIIVNYEYEEMDLHRTGKIVPIYNFMLEEYRPEWAQLYDIKSITECHMSPDVLDSQGKFQKFVYHNFFHIDGILRNLLLCRLVNESRVNMIRIHYNFLSKFVHASMSNLELYQTVRDYSSFQQLRADNIKELVLLYVTKLVSIYERICYCI